jgi:hypothetical protein
MISKTTIPCQPPVDCLPLRNSSGPITAQHVLDSCRHALKSWDVSLVELGHDYLDCPSAKNAALLCVLLAEPFVKSIAVADLIPVLAGGVFINQYSHIVDDLTDDPAMSDARLHHLSAFFFNEALSQFCRATHGSPEFLSLWNQYLREASGGERYLWSRSHVNSYESEPLRYAVASRGGLIKGAVAAMAFRSGRRDVLTDLSRAVDKLSFGVQVLDDVLDWAEDYANGVRTVPLVIALADTKIEDIDQIRARLFSPAILLDMFDTARIYIDESCAALRIAGASLSAEQVAELSNACESAITLVHHDSAQSVPRTPGALEVELRRLLEPRCQH